MYGNIMLIERILDHRTMSSVDSLSHGSLINLAYAICFYQLQGMFAFSCGGFILALLRKLFFCSAFLISTLLFYIVSISILRYFTRVANRL